MYINPCFKAAINLLDKGYSPVPCYLPWKKNKDGTDNKSRADKRCYIKWGAYQEKRPTLDELAEWWKKWPRAQLGIVTGPISGVFTLDLDVGFDTQVIKNLNIPKNTLIDKTPSGGWHVFFRYPEGKTIKTTADVLGNNSHIDIRGEGGITVISPSTYQDGRPYKWVNDPDNFTLQNAPADLLKIVSSDTEKKKERYDFIPIANGVSEDSRNNSAAKMIGLMVCYLPERHWGPVVWPMVQGWNANNSPPLEDEELYTTFISICNKQRVSTQEYFNNKKKE